MERLRESSIFRPVMNSARPYVPSDDGAEMELIKVDLILGEIDKEITRIEEEAEKKRQKMLRESHQPDYAWLLDYRLKPKKGISFRESSEAEFLCSKIKPDEWKRSINEWRIRIRFAQTREEVMTEFRNVIYDIVSDRYKRETSFQQINEQGSDEVENDVNEGKLYPAEDPSRDGSFNVKLEKNKSHGTLSVLIEQNWRPFSRQFQRTRNIMGPEINYNRFY